MKRVRFRYYLSGVTAAFLFGFSWVAMKQIQAVTDASVFDVMSLRYLTASAAMLLAQAFGLARISWRGRNLFPLALIALAQPILLNILEYPALHYMPSSELALFCGLAPLIAAVAGPALLGERVRPLQIVFVLIAVAGIIVMNIPDLIEAESGTLFGKFLAVCCVAACVVNKVLTRKHAGEYSSSDVSSMIVFLSAAVFTAVALCTHTVSGTLPDYFRLWTIPALWPHILFLGVGCGLLGFFFNAVSLRNLPITQSGVIASMMPAFAVLAGVVLLGETLSAWDLAGCLLIFTGILGTNLSRGRTV